MSSKDPRMILHNKLLDEARVLREKAIEINKAACEKEEQAAKIRQAITGMDKWPSKLVITR